METLDHDDLPTGHMWCAYAGGWAAYLLLLTIALQLDALRAGHFNTNVFMDVAAGIPGACALALLWPFSGWVERKRFSPLVATLVHVPGAILMAFMNYLSLLFRYTFDEIASWYMWPLLYGAMAYCLIATIFHMVRVSRARQRQTAAIERAQGLLLASELNALRSKLNPHFLFNTLHSIIALTRKDPLAAETALFQFSDMLRYVLDTEKNGNDRVALDDELDFVRDYLELEALRLGPRLNIDWDLDDAAGSHAVPALSLQPLVENSIKHAFNPHSRPGRLAIRTRVDPVSQALTITVADDGPGADAAAVRGSDGLGIRTVDRRLQLEYGMPRGLEIDTAPGQGFSVTVTIPSVPAEPA